MVLAGRNLSSRQEIGLDAPSVGQETGDELGSQMRLGCFSVTHFRCCILGRVERGAVRVIHVVETHRIVGGPYELAQARVD